jgi:hypothetical protein
MLYLGKPQDKGGVGSEGRRRTQQLAAVQQALTALEGKSQRPSCPDSLGG